MAGSFGFQCLSFIDRGKAAEGIGRPCLVEEIDIFPGRLLFGDFVCEHPPSDAHPFVWRVEHLISPLRNDRTLRDPGMTRRCLHKVLACLHLGYQRVFRSKNYSKHRI